MRAMRAQTARLVVGLVALATLAVHVQALTAFGKSQGNSEKDKPVTPAVKKGRACNTNTECAGMPSTTCSLDKDGSGKKHCVCKDGVPPVNSKCAVIPNIPGKACNEHVDCVSNAECLVSNETRKKTCTCKDGFEFDPAVDDLSCSGAAALWPCFATVLVTLIVLLVTEQRPQVTS